MHWVTVGSGFLSDLVRNKNDFSSGNAACISRAGDGP